MDLRRRSHETWQYFVHLLRYRGWNFWLATGFYTLYYALDLVPALIVRDFFNALSGNADARSSVWTLIALFAGAQIARAVVYYGVVIAEITYNHVLAALTRRNLFAQLLRQPRPLGVARSAGEIINQFRDDANTIGEFPGTLYNLIALTVFAIIALGIMFQINLQLTLIVFIPLIVTAIIANIASNRIGTYRSANRAATSRVSGAIGEIFGAAQAIKVANVEANVIAHLRKLNEVRRRAAVRDRVFSEVLNATFNNLGDLGTGMILLLAGQAMQLGTFTVGDFALYVYFIGWISAFTGIFGMSLSNYQQLGVSFDRISKLMPNAPPQTLIQHNPIYLRDTPPEIPYVTKTEEDRLVMLEVEGLAYHHADSRRGIAPINLRIPRGSFVVITGRIGSGKTTLLQTLLGFLPKEAGVIRWNGRVIDDPAAFFIPPRCAYTPQEPHLFSDTLSDNMLLGLPEAKADLPGAIHSAVLETDVAHMEAGLGTPVGSRGFRLSGGQIQRTAAARMFVRDAELLVFDDLSSALDVETERQLWNRLFNRRHITCLVVSHRQPVLQRADHIVVLDEGQVVAEGKLDRLLAECPQMVLST